MHAVQLRPLEPKDAGEVLTVQRAAFLSEARLHGTTEIPPLVETLDDVQRELAAALCVGAFVGSRLVGTARLTVDGSVGWISRVAVAPDQQGKGIGSALLAAVEELAPARVERFELAAGAHSTANVALYGRRGYATYDRITDSIGVELVLMGKDRETRPRDV